MNKRPKDKLILMKSDRKNNIKGIFSDGKKVHVT